MFMLAALCLAGAPAFAFVDGELYGGYNFSGKITSDSSSYDLKGANYGARFHFTSSGMLFSTGAGLFYQKSPLKLDTAAGKIDTKKTDIGPDAFARIEIIPVLKPYVRAGLSVYQKVDIDGSSAEKKYFKSYYYGAGLGLAAPTPLLNLMIFGEYLNSRRFSGDKLTLHTINGGVSIGF
jgi:hypothetical protein